MPLSGAVMISENTAAASSSRFAGSLSSASSGVSAKVVATVVAIINLTLHLPLCRPSISCSLSIRASALRGASEHVVDRLRRVGGQSVRVLVELAGHALRLVDPRERDFQSFRIVLAVEAF